MTKFFPSVAIVLGLVVFFAVPNQNGATFFDLAQKSLSENLGTIVVTKDPTQNPSSSASSAQSKEHNETTTGSSTSTSAEKVARQEASTKRTPETSSSLSDPDRVQTQVLGSEEENLSIPDAASYTTLTTKGVLEWTNYYRVQNSLPPLSQNTLLQTAASLKVHDMLRNQYFEHVSPRGNDISDVVTDLGYQYITVGENLALGNFHSSKDLVDAWMASPGHRENILNTSYEEIGIALVFGTFKGSGVYLASQEFGKPQSSCPMPSQQLKSRISIGRDNVAELSRKLDALRKELEKIDHSEVSEYNEKVDQYNALAKKINDLNSDLKDFIHRYNAEVDGFNQCATGTETHTSDATHNE